MKHPATLILFVLSIVSAGALFGISFEVSALEERLTAVNHEIKRDRDAIHVLRAEWSYLNQPDRLDGLTRRYLDLQPLDGNQLVEFAAVPSRAAPESAPFPPPSETVTGPPALELQFASTLKARPKLKPEAPRRPSSDFRLVSQPATTKTGLSASETADLDAALRAILGEKAARNRGQQR